MKQKLFLTLILFLAVGFTSCGKDTDDNGGGPNTPPSGEAAVISKLLPETVISGGNLYIIGTGFGTDKNAVTVYLNGESAEVRTVSNTRIQTTAPTGVEGTTVAVKVSINGVESNEVSTTLHKGTPLISSFVGRGKFDDVMTVKGKYFSTTVSDNKVYFDDVEANVVEASETELKVVTPRIYKSSVTVKAEVGGVATNTATYAYNLKLCDSVLVATADWATTTLKEGVVLKYAHFTAFGSIKSLCVLYITPSATTQLGIYHTGGKGGTNPNWGALKTTSAQCELVGATAGINGGYFDDKSPYIRVDGEEKQHGADSFSNATFANAAFGFTGTNVAIESTPNLNQDARKLSYDNIMNCGPLLLKNKITQTIANIDHNTTSHPRTAIGTTTDGKVIMLTVDGRMSGYAIGISNTNLASLMWMLGANDAMNLDGGKSTTMWAKGQGVVNYPCSNSTYDHEGEITVANIIYVK